MTVSNTQEVMVAGPNTSQTCAGVFPNIAKYISTKRRVTPLSKKTPEKKFNCARQSLQSQIHPSPPPHEKGPVVDTPIGQSSDSSSRAAYYIQNTKSYQNVSEVRYIRCLFCGFSVDATRRENLDFYMQRCTPKDELETVTSLRMGQGV